MNTRDLQELLSAIRDGRMAVGDALNRLRHWPAEDLGFATLDHHRDLRCGFPEVIFCQGKSTAQVVEIFRRNAAQASDILATRASAELFEAVREQAAPEARYNAAARCIMLRRSEYAPGPRPVALVSAGTADIPVAEEALETAQLMNQRVERFYDVGVAGVHRLLAHAARLREAGVVIVVAGMEGALPSVVGGLVDRPVIAVPTSVGYGASFGGLAALLGMLNSCASNVVTVNIDNGFSAGYTAALINRLAEAPTGAARP